MRVTCTCTSRERMVTSHSCCRSDQVPHSLSLSPRWPCSQMEASRQLIQLSKSLNPTSHNCVKPWTIGSLEAVTRALIWHYIIIRVQNPPIVHCMYNSIYSGEPFKVMSTYCHARQPQQTLNIQYHPLLPLQPAHYSFSFHTPTLWIFPSDCGYPVQHQPPYRT